MAKAALEILAICRSCLKVPKDFPKDPMYRGGMAVFNEPNRYGLTDDETEIVSASRNRSDAGLDGTLAKTTITPRNANLVAIVYQAGLMENGYWDRANCCAPCPNKEEYIELLFS